MENNTPQLNEHNEGIWAALESKVRTIAKGSDTTYVVTGVVVSPASRKTRDSYGNDMTIPDAYYKALSKNARQNIRTAYNRMNRDEKTFDFFFVFLYFSRYFYLI